MDRKKSNILSEHKAFLFIMLLFCMVSLYGIISFFDSTNDYIDNMYVSAVNIDSEENKDESDKLDVFAELFRDVGKDHVHSEAIAVLNAEGIIKGYDDGTFRPDDKINRAEILPILTNALDSDFSGRVLEDCFVDIQDQWFSVFVCYAKEQGWISGFADGSYRPERAISKAEALKIVFTAFDYEACDSVNLKPYEDVPIDSWFAPYACAAKKDKIISTNYFYADHKITRAEFIQIVYNVMVKKSLL
ncbi:hypothetical protein GF366_00970 [Candidatus Peregrinibacteria bacterium]|nr:hypothetical protein [Candidatus Peregrinibacteria bacterium]